MIDKDNEYITRLGYEVIIYSTDRGGLYPVHGAYYFDGDWHLAKWTKDGKLYQHRDSERDLEEIIETTFSWCNVYGDGEVGRCYATKELAKKHRSGLKSILGMIRIETTKYGYEVFKEDV